MSDQSVDPYYLGPSSEDLQAEEKRLVQAIFVLRDMVSLTHAEEWPRFEELIRERLRTVESGLKGALSWENVCRLQGKASVYEWLLDFARSQQVTHDAAMQELGELQSRMEAQT